MIIYNCREYTNTSFWYVGEILKETKRKYKVRLTHVTMFSSGCNLTELNPPVVTMVNKEKVRNI